MGFATKKLSDKDLEFLVNIIYDSPNLKDWTVEEMKDSKFLVKLHNGWKRTLKAKELRKIS